MRATLGLALAVASGVGLAEAATPSSTLLGLVDGKRDTGRTIALSADVACSPDKAYRLWATPEGARTFFAPSLTIEPHLGGQYTVAFYPADDPKGLTHGTAGARVLAQDPGRFFAFEWVTFAGDRLRGNNAPPYAEERIRRPDPLPTWVELTFTPQGQGAHVEFRHYGFGEGDLWSQSQTWFTRAWSGVLKSLAEACAKG